MLETKKSGFTLVEALVAITVLLLGVLGPLSVATRGITDGLIAKDKIVALQLAQEGIELVGIKVVSNSISGRSWLDGLGSNCFSACRVDVLTNEYSSCTSGLSGTCSLTQNSAGDYAGLYTYVSGLTGTFYRTIKITPSAASAPLVANAEAEVTVTVGWQDKAQPRFVTLSAYVYNGNPW